jgi:hypothetical protein
VDFASVEAGSLFGPPRNRLDLDDAQPLENLQAVQRQNGIAPDTALQTIEETINTVLGDHREKTDISGTLCLQFRQNKPPCFQTLLRPLNTYLFPMYSTVEGVRENHDVVQQLGSNQVVAM